MVTLREIRNRIRGVRKTQKITRAMKVVAATRLARAEKSVFAARPYAQRIREVLRSALASIEDIGAGEIPLLRQKEAGPINTSLIVITSDRGLCGGFNSNTFKRALDFIGEKPSGKVSLVVVGLKGQRYFQRLGLNIIAQYLEFTARPLEEIARKIMDLYLAQEIDQVYLLYNKFKTFMAGEIILERVLPAEIPKKRKRGRIDYLYEPSPGKVIEGLILESFVSEVYLALLESRTAEEAARMMAMDYATENAEDLIDDLTLSYHRKRQEAITREMMEIASGAEALK